MSVRKGSHVLRAAGLVLSVEVLGITLDQDGKCLARQRILGASEPKTHTEPYLHELHRRTFDRTWKWAGTDRNTEKNIGVSRMKSETARTPPWRVITVKLSRVEFTWGRNDIGCWPGS